MVKTAKPNAKVTIDRRAKAKDRRQTEAPVVFERREKVSRRRQIDPTTCERDYTTDEVEFMHALDRYKRSSGRMFPTCSEVLEVLRDLGYQKVAAVSTDSASPMIEPVGATPEALISSDSQPEHIQA